jgi:hypothetical protein
VRGTVEQLADPIVRSGLASTAGVALFLEASADPAVHYAPPLMVSTWGRRPSS